MPQILRTLRKNLLLSVRHGVLTKTLYFNGKLYHQTTRLTQDLDIVPHSLESWSTFRRAISVTVSHKNCIGRTFANTLLARTHRSKSPFMMLENTETSVMKSDRLIWVDLEMTGLDFVEDRILEVACLVTEGDLRLVAEGPHLIIHQSDEVLSRMGEWCVQHHGESGLTEAVRKSKISLADAEQMVLEFVRQHTPKGKCPLAGNTVGMDKSFIIKHMPLLAEHLHHRVVDVSTLKELCRRWYPSDLKAAPVKKENHRAMDDILESIEELKFYRSAIFK